VNSKNGNIRKAIRRTVGAIVGIALLSSCAGVSGVPQAAKCNDLKTCSCGKNPALGVKEGGVPTVVVATDIVTPEFSSAIKQLASGDNAAFTAIGITATPRLTLAKVDSAGAVLEIGTFDLAGSGRTNTRKLADARRETKCALLTLEAMIASEASKSNSTPATKASLLRAISKLTAIAKTTSESSALVLFGLGRSQLEGNAITDIDLNSPGARKHVVDELIRTQLMGTPTDASVTFVAPDSGVANGVNASQIRAFSTELCRAMTTGPCKQLAVL
jgi:hypothetical protein